METCHSEPWHQVSFKHLASLNASFPDDLWIFLPQSEMTQVSKRALDSHGLTQSAIAFIET